jgi:alpha-tubulin suppressor-like RCC1 family protein
MTHRARGLVVCLSIAVVLLAGGCSGDDSSEDDSAETTVGETTSTTTESVDETTTTEAADAEGFEASTLVAGDQHACALDADGAAWCWGYNHQGQLGDGSFDDAVEPTAVVGAPAFESLTAGRYFTCGLDADGAVWCWGDNSSGQLGVGTSGEGGDTDNRSEAAPVLGDVSFTQLASGQNHVCGIDGAGDLWCWGSYPSGQLGVALTDDATQPVRGAEGIVVADVAASGANTCVLDDSGAAWCFGNNSFGQLGNGVKDNSAQPVPVAVGGGSTFTDLAVGDRHACALDEVGAVWCWGGNDAGQLGDATAEEQLAPVAVDSDVEFASVFAGNVHTCALDGNGVAWCWGENTDGRLGDAEEGAEVATGDDAPAPVAVTTDLTWRLLALGEEFSCGLDADGVAWCWGTNRSGWLGDGTQDPRPNPTPVLASS